MVRALFACFGKGRSLMPSKSGRMIKPSPSEVYDMAVKVPEGPAPVLVELFSSQGCVASTAAELLMSRLGRGDFQLDFPVIILAYHVDYWDYKGWKDPFGCAACTVRQKAYVESFGLDTMFTPLAVIQGRAHCMANEEDELLSGIRGAIRFPAPAFQATFYRPSQGTLQLAIAGALRCKLDGPANLMVALYESGFVINCSSGDNQGKIFSNDFVVRRLDILCRINDDLSPQKPITGTIRFGLWEGFNASKCGVVVFVQNGAHQIFSSQNFRLPQNI